MGYSLNKNPQKIPTEHNAFQSKWYFSYPILILSLIFCLPCSLPLSIARLLIVKNQKKGYKIRSILAVIVNAGVLLLTIGVIFSSSKWERDYQKSIEAGEYQTALEILDNHYPATLSAQGLEYYFDTFSLSGNYQDIDRVVLKYYETLSDKAEFKTAIFDKINTLTDKLSKEQIDKLKEIEMEVKTAKAEKAKQLEKEAKSKAESESNKAAEESRIRAESESVKAAEESKTRAESESVKAAEESKTRTESEANKAAEESKARVESEAKKAEESKAKAESESVKAEEEAKAASQNKERIKKIIQAYKKDKSKKYIQELQREDENLVWSILKESISQSLSQNISDSQILLNIEEDCEIYEHIFSTINSELTELKQNIHKIKECEETINEIEKKYSFSIRDNVSIETSQWYVMERLSYANPIVDALDKTFSNGSNWIAYNITYIFGSPFPGDQCIVLHANELNPFSNSGSYTVDCVLTNKTETLVDTKGFQRSVPIYEIVNRESLLLDKKNITEAENEIEQLWQKIRKNYQIDYHSNTRTYSMPVPDSPDNSDAGNIMETPHIIIENSSSTYLSSADIDWMTPEQLRYAKNEIYARHGRKFSDHKLQEWFTAQSWYHGKIEPENFSEDMLSAVEKANIQMIQRQLDVSSQ